MIEADSVHSTPPLNSSASNIVALQPRIEFKHSLSSPSTAGQPETGDRTSGASEPAEVKILNLSDPIDELDRVCHARRCDQRGVESRAYGQFDVGRDAC
jgi:hypothetical protein